MAGPPTPSYLVALMAVTQMVARSRGMTTRPPSPFESMLDSLAWLLDNGTGGSSVPSIAVQQSYPTPIMWLATNASKHEEAVDHLKDLVERLVIGASAQWEGVEDEIVMLCIVRSVRKVMNYVKMLRGEFKLAREGTDLLASADLQTLLSLIEEHLQLQERPGIKICNAAYILRHSSLFGELEHAVKTATQGRAILSSIYHHIGRLGSWRHAARSIIEYAKTHGKFFPSCKVEIVRYPQAWLLNNDEPCPQLLTFVAQLVPEYDERTIAVKLSRISGISLDRLQQKFAESYTRESQQFHVHSEVAMLDHFQRQGLRFYSNVRYIGCSKPSCYLCDIYLRLDSRNAIHRPCHNKLWMGWAQAAYGGSPDLESTRRDVFLSNAKHQMESDIIDSIRRRLPVRVTMFDSTSGYTKSVHNR